LFFKKGRRKIQMVDLTVELAGLKLKNPIIAGAGPNTKNVSSSIDCMKGGFGAIVVRSLHIQFLNQVRQPTRGFWRIYGTGKNFRKDLYSFMSTGAPAQRIHKKVDPGFGGASPFPTLDQYAEELRKIVRAARGYDCAVIASIGWCGSNLSTEEVWKTEAKAMTYAGVDAIQLHTAPSPATEPGRFLTKDPQKHMEMPIRFTKEATHLPVFAKIPVDCCDPVLIASVAQKAGADGVVPVTRWLSIPIDIDQMQDPVWRGPGIGGPWSVPIMNGLIFRFRNARQPVSSIYREASKEEFTDNVPITVPIIASGGVRSGADVIGYIAAGANAAEICAQVLLEGPAMAKRVEEEMRTWMAGKGYKRLSEFQGFLKLMEHSRAREMIPQWQPVVDKELCNACGICVKACANVAISLQGNAARVDDEYCEGCRTCYYVCPQEAISLNP
jgi:dihydroorotate dehydrogenase/Pyruvate/2-oxoacid:ferredoxin oxidoreductase delta subunit